jgi:surface polysaccharide O-acyltransferase-like enzyme
MEPETSRRLDYFRILATFFVVGIHTNSGLSSPEGIRFNISLGLDVLYRTAVPGFYLLTGYLLVDRADYTASFFYGRLQKIMPAWFFWSVIYLVYRVAFLGNSISILSGIRCLWVGDTYYHFWFMYSLLGLYLSLPVLKFFCNAAGIPKILIAAAIFFVLNIMLVDLGNWAIVSGFSFVPAAQFPGFSQSMLLALLGWWLKRWKPKNIHLVAGTLGFVVLYSLAFAVAVKKCGEANSYSADAHVPTLILPMSVLLSMVVLHAPGQTPQLRLLRPLSDASFAIYLAHPLIYEVLVAPWSRTLLGLVPGAEAVFTFSVTAGFVSAVRMIPLLRRFS